MGRADPIERVLNLLTLLHESSQPLMRAEAVAELVTGSTPYPTDAEAERQAFTGDRRRPSGDGNPARRAVGRAPYSRAMAILHNATITPTKLEVIATWAPTQPWGPPAGESLEVVGAFRFDDPDGKVGMETHVVSAAGTVYMVPLTYREAPLDGADDGLASRMDHSVLGTRWIYDGLRDPLFVTMLAAVSMTGQGEALGLAVYDGRWYVAPATVRISGGGWGRERVPVDAFELERDDAGGTILRNERFQLDVFRRPVVGPKPPIGLTAAWDGQDAPVVLTSFSDTAAP